MQLSYITSGSHIVDNLRIRYHILDQILSDYKDMHAKEAHTIFVQKQLY